MHVETFRPVLLLRDGLLGGDAAAGVDEVMVMMRKGMRIEGGSVGGSRRLRASLGVAMADRSYEESSEDGCCDAGGGRTLPAAGVGRRRPAGRRRAAAADEDPSVSCADDDDDDDSYPGSEASVNFVPETLDVEEDADEEVRP